VSAAAALAAVLADELIRCGLREAVLAPGSRSAPLAVALHQRAEAGDVRLHVRVDERSAAFLALGMAKASRVPVVVLCTSGTAAAHLHAAVIEADEAVLPLLVCTADRPPELRGTGANQTIDQVKLFGAAVRWFAEVGDAGPDASWAAVAAYWRSLACRAWATASGAAGGPAGPVHLNLPFREPLVPSAGRADPGFDSPDSATQPDGATPPGMTSPAGPDLLDVAARFAGRPGGRPWTGFGPPVQVAEPLRLPWTERGVVVCGDGDYDPRPLLELAASAGWPVLAEPSSSARRGPNALAAYPYLLSDPAFAAAHRPDLILSAGRPGLSRGQLALLRSGASRHVVISQAPGRWADPARSATDITPACQVQGAPADAASSGWLRAWWGADEAARQAVDLILDAETEFSEPRLARDLAAALPDGALLWVASSLPVRDLDQHLRPRHGLRILADRGASGIDGLVSAAQGAALAHQRDGGGPAAALLGDLALLHDSPGLIIGPAEPRADLCLVVANNDGGGIFSTLEHAANRGPFERVFGTPHRAGLRELAAAAGVPYVRITDAGGLAAALQPGWGGASLRLAELRTDRAGQAQLRARLAAAATKAIGSGARA
jgi:2-succinyl-5-enolpyruvyl-6-hydroxy-3-cyclohexene-1-carboxylate synthase